jgi:hypothetical protein
MLMGPFAAIFSRRIFVIGNVTQTLMQAYSNATRAHGQLAA